MTGRDDRFAALEAERCAPTPPHRVLPAEPPTPSWQVDTPGRIAARRRTLRRETEPATAPADDHAARLLAGVTKEPR